MVGWNQSSGCRSNYHELSGDIYTTISSVELFISPRPPISPSVYLPGVYWRSNCRLTRYLSCSSIVKCARQIVSRIPQTHRAFQYERSSFFMLFYLIIMNRDFYSFLHSPCQLVSSYIWLVFFVQKEKKAVLDLGYFFFFDCWGSSEQAIVFRWVIPIAFFLEGATS
jgi:hypothetical protein